MISNSSASTTKVYGRLRAMRTSAIIKRLFLQVLRKAAGLRPAANPPALIYPNWREIANARRQFRPAAGPVSLLAVRNLTTV
jgi:hypothetical protein